MICKYRTKIPICIGESNNVRVMCNIISEQDESFTYKIDKLYNVLDRTKFEAVLVIRSCTEEKAHKRGCWFINKCNVAKIADYYWVK